MLKKKVIVIIYNTLVLPQSPSTVLKKEQVEERSSRGISIRRVNLHLNNSLKSIEAGAEWL